MIRAKRKPGHYYYAVLAVVIFIAFSSLFCLLIWISKQGLDESSLRGTFIVLVINLTIGFLMYRVGLAGIPSVAVDEKSITVNGDHIEWDKIEKVDLTSRMSYRKYVDYRVRKSTEITLFLKSGSMIYLYSEYYNLWLIKSFIQQVFIDNGNYLPIDLVVMENVESVEAQVLCFGTKFINWGQVSGLIFLSFLLLSFEVVLIYTKAPIFVNMVFIIYVLLGLLLYGRKLFYYNLAEKNLIINNQIFRWVQRVYNINDIRELILRPGYQIGRGRGAINIPYRMTVTTVDFKNHTYGGDSLEAKDWINLRDILINRGINVRDEMELYKGKFNQAYIKCYDTWN